MKYNAKNTFRSSCLRRFWRASVKAYTEKTVQLHKSGEVNFVISPAFSPGQGNNRTVNGLPITESVFYSFIRSFVRSFIRSSIRSLVCSIVCLFACLLVCLFACLPSRKAIVPVSPMKASIVSLGVSPGMGTQSSLVRSTLSSSRRLVVVVRRVVVGGW